MTGNIVYGISAGYFNQLQGVYDKYKGQTKVELTGANTISLNNSGTGTAVHAAIKANVSLGSADIRFRSEKTSATQNIGLRTESEGNISVGSLSVGTVGVTDPTEITAIYTFKNTDLYNVLYKNSGSIKVNQDGKGTVKIREQVHSGDDGTVDLRLSDASSYWYGNSQNFVEHIVTDTSAGKDTTVRRGGTINLSLTNGARWINVRGASDEDSHITKLTLSNGAVIDMTETAYGDFSASRYRSIYVDGDMDGSGGTIHMDIDAATNENNSERFYVRGTHTGETYVTLNNLGAVNDGARGTVLVSVGTEQGVFKANDREGTLYWNKYTLASQASATDGYTTDWYLEKAEPVSPDVKPATTVEISDAAGTVSYYGFRDLDKLMRRMGELRHNRDEEKGLWLRLRGTEYTNRKHVGAFKAKELQYQLGYDGCATGRRNGRATTGSRFGTGTAASRSRAARATRTRTRFRSTARASEIRDTTSTRCCRRDGSTRISARGTLPEI